MYGDLAENSKQFYKNREEEIMNMRDDGKSFGEIAERFNISRARVQQIYYKPTHLRGKFGSDGNRAFYNALRTVAKEYDVGGPGLDTRTYNALCQAKIFKYGNDLSIYSDEYLLSLPGIGVNCLKIIRLADKICQR